MGWENRARGGPYYTRSRRDGDRVVREYCGSGFGGRLAALADEFERLRREEEDLRWREERERLERAAAFLGELEEATRTVTTAHLIAAGARKRKGQWRFKRT